MTMIEDSSKHLAVPEAAPLSTAGLPDQTQSTVLPRKVAPISTQTRIREEPGEEEKPERPIEVSDVDVVAFTGGRCRRHPGTIRFSKLVAEAMVTYMGTAASSRKKVQSEAIESIMKAVQDSGGRFLELNDCNQWYVVEWHRVRQRLKSSLTKSAELWGKKRQRQQKQRPQSQQHRNTRSTTPSNSKMDDKSDNLPNMTANPSMSVATRHSCVALPPATLPTRASDKVSMFPSIPNTVLSQQPPVNAQKTTGLTVPRIQMKTNNLAPRHDCHTPIMHPALQPHHQHVRQPVQLPSPKRFRKSSEDVGFMTTTHTKITGLQQQQQQHQQQQHQQHQHSRHVLPVLKPLTKPSFPILAPKANGDGGTYNNSQLPLRMHHYNHKPLNTKPPPLRPAQLGVQQHLCHTKVGHRQPIPYSDNFHSAQGQPFQRAKHLDPHGVGCHQNPIDVDAPPPSPAAAAAGVVAAAQPSRLSSLQDRPSSPPMLSPPSVAVAFLPTPPITTAPKGSVIRDWMFSSKEERNRDRQHCNTFPQYVPNHSQPYQYWDGSTADDVLFGSI